MTTRLTIIDGGDHATDAHRAALLSLAGRIRDAVRPHVPGAHVQVDVQCGARGIHAPSTVALISVRVGEWGTGARVALDGHHATRATREIVTVLRDRLTARLAWHEMMARGCRYALAVAEAEVSRG
jgi:hypothetical protein